MKKHSILLIILSFFFILTMNENLFAQEKPDSAGRVVDIISEKNYKVHYANHYMGEDTIPLIGTLYPDPLDLFFVKNDDNDSTTIVIEQDPEKLFLIGAIKYNQSIHQDTTKLDIYKGKLICVVNRKTQNVDLLFGKLFEGNKKEDIVYRMLILYKDSTALELIYF